MSKLIKLIVPVILFCTVGSYSIELSPKNIQIDNLDKKVVRSFFIHNTGGRRVTVDSIRVSSNVVSIKSKDQIEIPRKAKEEIFFEISPSSNTRKIKEQVTVYLQEDSLSITISATTTQILSPKVLDLGPVFQFDTLNVEKSFSIKAQSRPLWGQVKTLNKATLNATVKTVSDKKHTLTIRVAAGHKTGIVRDTIKVVTGLKEHRILRIPITYSVVPILQSNTDVLKLGKLTTGQQVETSIKVDEVHPKKNFIIDRIKISPNFITSTQSRIGDTKRVIYIKTTPKGYPRPFKGTIDLYISNTNEPALIIPLTGEVTE